MSATIYTVSIQRHHGYGYMDMDIYQHKDIFQHTPVQAYNSIIMDGRALQTARSQFNIYSMNNPCDDIMPLVRLLLAYSYTLTTMRVSDTYYLDCCIYSTRLIVAEYIRVRK